jgi:hypothetical protein
MGKYNLQVSQEVARAAHLKYVVSFLYTQFFQDMMTFKDMPVKPVFWSARESHLTDHLFNLVVSKKRNTKATCILNVKIPVSCIFCTFNVSVPIQNKSFVQNFFACVIITYEAVNFSCENIQGLQDIYEFCK